MQIGGILLMADIEKAFDSVDHLFLVSALEKYGFKNDFIRWIKLLLKNQESRIINREQTTNNFKLKKCKVQDKETLYQHIFSFSS